ncbi:hypothetical protein MXB_2850, partial [Myxobolus squamalis]
TYQIVTTEFAQGIVVISYKFSVCKIVPPSLELKSIMHLTAILDLLGCRDIAIAISKRDISMHFNLSLKKPDLFDAIFLVHKE